MQHAVKLRGGTGRWMVGPLCRMPGSVLLVFQDSTSAWCVIREHTLEPVGCHATTAADRVMKAVTKSGDNRPVSNSDEDLDCLLVRVGQGPERRINLVKRKCVGDEAGHVDRTRRQHRDRHRDVVVVHVCSGAADDLLAENEAECVDGFQLRCDAEQDDRATSSHKSCCFGGDAGSTGALKHKVDATLREDLIQGVSTVRRFSCPHRLQVEGRQKLPPVLRGFHHHYRSGALCPGYLGSEYADRAPSGDKHTTPQYRTCLAHSANSHRERLCQGCATEVESFRHRDQSFRAPRHVLGEAPVNMQPGDDEGRAKAFLMAKAPEAPPAPGDHIHDHGSAGGRPRPIRRRLLNDADDLVPKGYRWSRDHRTMEVLVGVAPAQSDPADRNQRLVRGGSRVWLGHELDLARPEPASSLHDGVSIVGAQTAHTKERYQW